MTDATFEAEVLKSDVPVLVDFWAPWCGPCRMIAPLIDQLAEEYAGKLKAVRVIPDQRRPPRSSSLPPPNRRPGVTARVLEARHLLRDSRASPSRARRASRGEAGNPSIRPLLPDHSPVSRRTARSTVF